MHHSTSLSLILSLSWQFSRLLGLSSVNKSFSSHPKSFLLAADSPNIVPVVVCTHHWCTGGAGKAENVGLDAVGTAVVAAVAAVAVVAIVDAAEAVVGVADVVDVDTVVAKFEWVEGDAGDHTEGGTWAMSGK